MPSCLFLFLPPKSLLNKRLKLNANILIFVIDYQDFHLSAFFGFAVTLTYRYLSDHAQAAT
jgi:hypothetical protein